MTTLPRTEDEIEIVAEVREGEYGGKLAAIEPGGAEFIPLQERHGNPLQLLWTWTSPNLEFATVFVGVLGVAAFGLSFWQATAALILGTLLGSLTHAALSAQGPLFGVPQMILSRIPFGYRGNWLPAGLNSITAGIGWFAVNSVSGAFALNTLTHMPKWLSLLIIVVAQLTIAFFGHNLAHVVEKWALPVLGLAFLLAAISIFSKANASAPHGPNASFGLGGTGGFMLTLGGAFGYAVGWNPFASDYTRYMKPSTSPRADWTLRRLGRVRVVRGARDDRRRVRDDRQVDRRVEQPDECFHRAHEHGAGRLRLGRDRDRGRLRERAEHLLRRDVVPDSRLPAAAGAASRDRRGGRRHHRLHRRADRSARRRREVHQLPARRCLLDRAVAGRHVLRHAAAPAGARRRIPVRHQAQSVGRLGVDGRRDGGQHLAVLRPDQVPRADPEGTPRARRPHLRGRLRARRRAVRDLLQAAGRPPLGGVGHPRVRRRPPRSSG